MAFFNLGFLVFVSHFSGNEVVEMGHKPSTGECSFLKVLMIIPVGENPVYSKPAEDCCRLLLD